MTQKYDVFGVGNAIVDILAQVPEDAITELGLNKGAMTLMEPEQQAAILSYLEGKNLSLASGEQIPIEQRDRTEITHGFGCQTAPDGVQVYNPAFDVTPADLITAIICERGIIRPVNRLQIEKTLADIS